MSQASTTKKRGSQSPPLPEVLTLEEAAEYLRVAESDVVDLATKHRLPGRKIGGQWRFLRIGLADWLLEPSGKERVLRHAGTLRDDPDREAMLEQIYQDRGRSMTEESQ